MLTSVATARDATNDRADGAALTLLDQLRFVASRRGYLRVLLVGFLQKLAEGTGTAASAYFCVYVVHQPLSSVGMVMVGGTISQVLTQGLWLKASKRWSPTVVYAIAVALWCFNLACWMAMRGQPPLVLLALGLGAGAAAGGVLMVTLSLLSTTLAAEAAKTGVNRDGVFSGFWLASEKLAFALGALLVGVVIGLFGFVERSDGVTVTQPFSALIGIAISFCGINALAALLSLLVMGLNERRESRARPLEPAPARSAA
jgi:Na+/melibiose symporter-like transporter